MTKEELLEKIIHNAPKAVDSKKRFWTAEMKEDITKYIYGWKASKEEKDSLLKILSLNQNQVPRWNRSRSEESIKTRSRQKSKSMVMFGGKVKNVSQLKMHRVVGTNLKKTLLAMREDDIVSKVRSIDALSSAGYKESEMIPLLNTLPTLEEWEIIREAIAQLSKHYSIERKQNA